jgi:hypothetical protein
MEYLLKISLRKETIKMNNDINKKKIKNNSYTLFIN